MKNDSCQICTIIYKEHITIMSYQVIDILTIVISLIIAYKCLKKIKESSIYIIYFFFFFIYIIPLILDYVIGLPKYLFYWDATNSTYDKYEGFIKSYKDVPTRIIYDVFIILFQIILLRFRPKLKTHGHIDVGCNTLIIRKNILLLLVLLSFIPIIFSVAVGYYYIPILYGWRENPFLSFIQESNYYSTIERLTYIGITASLLCLMAPKQNLFFKILMLIICYMNISIESKRSIIFFAMAVFFLLKYSGYGGKIKTVKLAIIAIIGVGVMIAYSIYIKTHIRGYTEYDQLYTNIRIDLFRDDTMRLVIYSIISNMKSVIDYPFQSYLTEIIFIFPLDILNGLFRLEVPQVGFNTYLTSALIGAPLSAGERWMTTSMIDEAIANFFLIGCIIVPIILGKISHFVDRSKPFVQVVLLSSVLLTFMYSFNYIAYYLEFALIISLLIKKTKYEKVRHF